MDLRLGGSISPRELCLNIVEAQIEDEEKKVNNNDLSKVNGGKEELVPELMESISKICLDLAYSESLMKSTEE